MSIPLCMSLICSLDYCPTPSSQALTQTRAQQKPLVSPFSQILVFFLAMIRRTQLSGRDTERERDEGRHKGTCHTIPGAVGLTGTLRTWHLYQLGTKCRWYQAVSALQLIRRHSCFGSVRAVGNHSQLRSGLGHGFGT